MSLLFDPGITVAVDVTDWNAARKWYTEKLGFVETWASEEGGWADFRPVGDNISIGLNRLEEGTPDPGAGGVTVTFGVRDIEAARSELESRGVEFEGETNELPGLVKLAVFHDPDGNIMMLAQSLMA
jgi:catechol 2,3-dioxygenase-like lactoylglutathione lyase family enzyme